MRLAMSPDGGPFERGDDADDVGVALRRDVDDLERVRVDG